MRFPRRQLLSLVPGTLALGCQRQQRQVALTFDGAAKAHRTIVAPLLKKWGWGATFFVTHRWMTDPDRAMTWSDIAELAGMGFEIGSQGWTGPDLSIPGNAARLEGELALVESALAGAGVAHPTCFAYPDGRFGPEAVKVLRKTGYRVARRGPEPGGGPLFDPQTCSPFLVPTSAIAQPGWEPREILTRADEEAQIPVLQFPASFPDELLGPALEDLYEQGCRGTALIHWTPYFEDDARARPVAIRYPELSADEHLLLPVEVAATRADLDRWLGVMARHRYTVQEATAVGALNPSEQDAYRALLASAPSSFEGPAVFPYPGGRNPRIGYLEGAINPHRGVKATVFLPWNPSDYIVVDIPEAIFSNLGLTFLAHTHLNTIWNDRNIVIVNHDWECVAGGGLRSRWELPNGISFGSEMRAVGGEIAMNLWLHNGTAHPLSDLRSKVCLLLKGAPDFNQPTTDNRILQTPVAAIHSPDKSRWLLTTWRGTGRCGGNERCPCLHADPTLPDCGPGDTVSSEGRLWFYEGNRVEEQLERAARLYI